MATKAKKVELGQQVFTLSKDGDVVRTLVAKLFRNGSYRLLNGADNSCGHWFTLDEALVAADKYLERAEKRVQQHQLRLARKRQMLKVKGYLVSVMSAPLKVVDLRETEKRNRSRKLMNVSVPKVYTLPGELVFVAITPAVGPTDCDFRPYQYFVLETEVLSVGFTPEGQPYYSLSTPFEVAEFFSSQADALAAVRKEGGLAADFQVPFVSKEEEKRGIRKADEANPPF